MSGSRLLEEDSIMKAIKKLPFLLVAFSLLANSRHRSVLTEGIILMSESQFRTLIRSIHPLSFQWSGRDDLCFSDLGCFDRQNGAMRHLGLLPHLPDEIGTKFRFYNRNSRHDPVALSFDDSKNPIYYLNSSLPVIVIIHGWNYQTHPKIFEEMKEAFLDKLDTNIIFVDWSSGTSHIDYISCVVNSELVGRQVAVLLEKIVNMGGIDPKSIHIVGFSIGGQVAGFTGKWTRTRFGFKIGRITALDPAGFLYEQMDNETHLSKDDADFVDIIHTDADDFGNTGSLGMIKPIGHVDFYPNGGNNQPSCYSTLCSHFRSVFMYIATINSTCSYKAYPCESYEKFLEGHCFDCSKTGCGIMGYNSIQSEGRGIFYLKTFKYEPYCSILHAK